MSKDLHSRYGGWALVTGASSGIGEALALAAAARGFPVVLVARRRDRLEALAARIAAEHRVETLVVAEDLSQRGACERVRDAIGAREVGLLVNNAGFGFSGRFAENDAEDDEQMIAVNCASVVRLTHLFLPAMLARGRGGVVVVASVAGYQATPWFAIYGATKAFDLFFAEALASELRGTGVEVVAVSPGETRTEFHERAHAKRQFRGHEPSYVAEVALRALGRKDTVVPGLLNKVQSVLARFFPRRFATGVTGLVLAKMLLKAGPGELRRRPYGGATSPRSR